MIGLKAGEAPSRWQSHRQTNIHSHLQEEELDPPEGPTQTENLQVLGGLGFTGGAAGEKLQRSMNS